MFNKTPPLLSTKAKTLSSVYDRLKKSRIEKLFFFNLFEWKSDNELIIKKIQQYFKGEKIVIRSSSTSEDTAISSMAGCFESVLGVDSSKKVEIEESIKKVVLSFKKNGAESAFNQILVQTHAKKIIMSGVIFTRVPETNAPYYVINYSEGGKTDLVTSGVENKFIKIYKKSKKNQLPTKIQKLLDATREIEILFNKDNLDIEFGINEDVEVIIFQIRPLTTTNFYNYDKEIDSELTNLKNKFNLLIQKKSHLFGEKSILADMPDWNPAEIIGNNPNYLDYSLYDFIITNEAWHLARTSQGYKNVFPSQLVWLLGTKPYVDVRASFNSFVPSKTPPQLTKKLVSFYLNKFKRNPQWQDKVEFKIVFSCYDFMFDERAKELREYDFSDSEIQNLKIILKELTNNLIASSDSDIKKDMDSLALLKERRKKILLNIKEDYVLSMLKCAKELLNDCRLLGTVQFSRLARLGFIGKILLETLVHRNIISQDFSDSFMSSISTVASEFADDFHKLNTGTMPRETFAKKYYHLRPGTYDITHPRYGQELDFLGTIKLKDDFNRIKKFYINESDKKKIDSFLASEGMLFDSEKLFNFIKKSLEARESSKFEFTKNLSDAIELIAMSGKALGFSRSEMSMLCVSDILNGIEKKSRIEISREWADIIIKRKKLREVHSRIELPPILFSDQDFDVINFYTPRPNFITRKKVKAKIVNLNESTSRLELVGKIVLIESGDPGYDWIFTKGIAGLITKYGGVASHMSIRCAEFGIPAAIGSGILFDQIKGSKEDVVLDCNLKKIYA